MVSTVDPDVTFISTSRNLSDLRSLHNAFSLSLSLIRYLSRLGFARMDGIEFVLALRQHYSN